MVFVRSRLLLVDDDADMRRVLGAFLNVTFDVVEAADGKDAIAQLEAGAFDAVLTDLAMPRLDGAALVDWITANRPELAPKTFVITGGASLPRLKAWLAAFDQSRVFSKPFDPAAIAARITATIRS
jgi:CheY-like chemotaxis protein